MGRVKFTLFTEWMTASSIERSIYDDLLEFLRASHIVTARNKQAAQK